MPWKLLKVIGLILIAIGAATIVAQAQEPAARSAIATASASPLPLPNPVAQPSMRFGPSDTVDPSPVSGPVAAALPAVTPAAPRVVTPTVPPAAPAAPAAATGPASTTPTPAITVTIPHDEHLHFTVVRHWHFPSRTAKATPAAPAKPPVDGAAVAPGAGQVVLFRPLRAAPRERLRRPGPTDDGYPPAFTDDRPASPLLPPNHRSL